MTMLIMVITAHADSKHKRVQASHYTKVNWLLFFGTDNSATYGATLCPY